ncbi:MAG: glycosyltransferase family 1 protein [Planctomycetes bacterium]|nr:glycosyltransferase family 1 protein [Planctomycetota bacterium]
MKPTVGLDLSCLEVQPETGVERYARRLVEQLPLVAPDLEFVVLIRPGRPAPAASMQVRVVEVPSLLPRAIWREGAMPRAMRRLGVQLLHAPVAALPFRTSAMRIATIHDVPRYGEAGHAGRLSRNRLRLLHALRAAHHIVVPSEATRLALIAAEPAVEARVTAIAHGVDPDFRPFGLPLRRDRYGIPPGPFLLWVGTLRQRKDPLVLVEAFARLMRSGHPPMHLVMCGKALMDEADVRAPLRAAGIDDRLLILPGYVAREDLPDLYREAEAVVVPSRLEGFGLPALEAMASGRPLVISEDAALTEVCGNAAQSFRTGDAHDLAHVLQHLLRDSALKAQLCARAVRRSQEYSWEASARSHAELYRSVLSSRSAPTL